MNITRLVEEAQTAIYMMRPHSDTGVVRVFIHPSGAFDIIDFRVGELDKPKRREWIPQEKVPTWVMNAVCMLRIAAQGELIPGLGFKVADNVYYLVDEAERSYDDEKNNAL